MPEKYHVTFVYLPSGILIDTQVKAEDPQDARAAALTAIAARMGWTQNEAETLLQFQSALVLTKQSRLF